nr:MAG TPA: terminase large subunit [Bacteriophage sp.]
MQPTLKVRGKKTLIISTPNGKANIFYKLYNSYPSITKTIYDDSYCKDIEAVKRNTPEIIFK